MTARHLDALVVGAGYGGIYMLYRLRELGLSARAIDLAGDVGGTWYWNRYPGAMSDTESYVYRFSWDKEDLQTYPWSHHYVKQPDVLAYLQHVVERHDLRKDMQFNTELLSAEWDDDSRQWIVETESHGTRQQYVVRYLVTALGVLSSAHYPDISGIESFKGNLCHTASWDNSLDLTNKRVGVIGNGSTGVQVITAISKDVSKLVSFQRHPQYSVPSGDRPVDPSYRKWVNENYDDIWHRVKNSITGFGFQESQIPFQDVPESERNAVFESLWQQGNGFRFMFGGFSDIAVNREANAAACEFIRGKIGQIVKDPEKARKLKPQDHYARRPLCDGGYYKQFNRDHVDIVSLKETPITAIRENGIETSDGQLHELDVIIFATGFDAIEGSYNRLRIKGRGGLTLKEHWEPQGATSYLGISVPHFPNMFLIAGPQGPFANLPPAIEAHVVLASRLISRAEKVRAKRPGKENPLVEALPEAEQEWLRECDAAAEGSLFKETASWIFGSNVPGKKYAIRFFFGGMQKYYEALERMVQGGYRGYKPLVENLEDQLEVHNERRRGEAAGSGKRSEVPAGGQGGPLRASL
ncbi:uncharacterized protein HMPREF1541_05727 [Cyphellophora europaea CBS 101466]|uniref:FAD/NAD(P)-binding domain-containing protein n=1 Tax=Cyphellophora europaea (strain CBS 101466) TaxID=1220924 RepID=W2RSL6_CYPE1|nr:uncharacterized protein HMPREF1541_05727 [Cyphellophora europaea CBS 101466]ETN39501.1 hypothetical protein HMPREF1541_05727 [Cyphellophora europaea CBS 101466]